MAFTVLTYVTVSAARIGVDSDFAFYFVAIANASSMFGRYAAGYICDSIGEWPSLKFTRVRQLNASPLPGPMNVMIPFTAAAGIVTYAWPFAQTKASLIAVTVIYGYVRQ